MSGSAPVRVFLSYRRDDTQHVAGRLFDRLVTSLGASNVFMDVVSIGPGADFGHAIEQAVGRCNVLLALVGKAWLSITDEHGRRRLDNPDDLVALEIVTALTSEIMVIPILVDGASGLRSDELPTALAPLARRNAFRLDHESFSADVERLLDTLNRLKGETEPRGLLGGRWRRRRIAAAVGHTIVCGNGDAAFVLARNLRESGRAVVLVGSAIAETPGNGAIPTISGDPREPATLYAAGIVGASDLYACAPRGFLNVAVALAAGRLRTEFGTSLSTFVQVGSDDLVEALRVRRLAGTQPDAVSMEFFAIDGIAARMVVERYPAGAGTPVVVGFGPLGQAVLQAIVRDSGVSSPVRTVVVVSTAPDDAVVAQEAARLDAAARGWDVRPGAESDGDGPVYVCVADEDEAVSMGLRLARADDRDVVLCLQRESPFREALASDGRLKIFGVLDEACTAHAIAGDLIISRAARAIHERYRIAAVERGETLATNPSMVPWSELPMSLQESNRAQAEHIGAKLAEIGASQATRPPAVPFAFTDYEVVSLARIEHHRWMEERTAAGYHYGPRREGRAHPDLVDWSDLGYVSQRKSIDAVLHLPDLLAAEGLYIQRDQ